MVAASTATKRDKCQCADPFFAHISVDCPLLPGIVPFVPQGLVLPFSQGWHFRVLAQIGSLGNLLKRGDCVYIENNASGYVYVFVVVSSSGFAIRNS